MRFELLPELVKIVLVLLDKLRVVEDNEVLLVGADSLRSPVEAASDEDLIINQHVLVVHVGSEVIIGCSFDPL